MIPGKFYVASSSTPDFAAIGVELSKPFDTTEEAEERLRYWERYWLERNNKLFLTIVSTTQVARKAEGKQNGEV